MNCSCIKGNFNYYADAIDTKTIIFQDLSEWMDEDGYEVPTEYTMTVIPPATSKSYSVTVRVGQLNRLTEDQIGTIRDGIYCFKVESCGVSYSRSTAIFPKLSCCVSQLWATLESSRHPEIVEIENHLKVVSSHIQSNNIQSATSELNIAKKLLENIKCDCDC